MPEDLRHQLELFKITFENRLQNNEKEISYLKIALDKQDDKLAKLEQELDTFKTERENNVKASRNVIIGALISLAVGVGAFLIQRGLS